MSIKLSNNETTYIVQNIFYDRDSIFLDYHNYWERYVGFIAQLIAENTTSNWDKFNLVRTSVIKSLGINPESASTYFSSPINILPVNVFPGFITSSLRTLLDAYNLDDLNILIQDLNKKAINETSKNIHQSLKTNNIEYIKNLNVNVSHSLLTNDFDNDIFVKSSGLENKFYKSFTLVNKEEIFSLLNNDSVFISNNKYIHEKLLKNNANSILIENLSDLSIESNDFISQVNIFIDGASKGNPGPAGIGIAFYSNENLIKEVSESIGIRTNNYAEYTALIRALEVAYENNFKNIEVISDSELVVKQLNGEYKVRDADIKELFNKVILLVKNFSSFKIRHVRREENQKADKLANQALKSVLNN